MEVEWVTERLRDVCVTITDGAHNSPKEEPNGLPMASVKNLTRHGIDLSGVKRISAEDFARLKQQGCMPLPGDVLIAKDGNSALDTVCIQNSATEVVLLSSIAILRPNNKITSGFLRYYLDAPQTRRMLKEGYRSGSAIPRVVLRDFRLAPITYPPLHAQQAIAHILSAFDDKIDLNRRMNQTLESMARAIFKSWFVDFDGCTVFQDSELGKIPKEWEVGTISDFASVNPESWTKKNHPKSINYVDLKNTKNGVIQKTERYNFTDAPSRARRILKKGDTILGTVRPGNRSFSFIMEDGLTGSTGFAAVRPFSVAFREYTYICLTNDDSIEHFAHIADGAAYPAIRPEVVSTFPIAKPPDELINSFNAVAAPILLKVHNNHVQDRSLSQIMDTLLPKLISGELRVPDAEKMAGEVL